MKSYALGLVLVGVVGLAGCTTEVGDDSLPVASEEALTGEYPVGTELYTTAEVNLRKGPGTNHAVIDVLPSGTRVLSASAKPQGVWYGVTASSGTGWVHGNFLTRKGTPAAPPSSAQELPAACEAAKSGDYFQFLDDVCKAKKYPSRGDRGHTCPVVDSSPTETLASGRTVTYRPATAPIEVDSEALKSVLPDHVQMTVILVKRVGGVPHYRYLSNGFHSTPYQPWSTTKFLAAANAAARLRQASGYKVGLTASVNGIPLGDLVTTIHKYDNNPYSSNSTSAYFHNVGGRQRANDLIHGLWLKRPASETFGGNYGEAAAPAGYTFLEPSGASVSLAPDTATGFQNKLSQLTMVEALKRLVMHREDASTRLPGIQWADVETLLYGAAKPKKYSTPWGGMSADTAIYLQTALEAGTLEQRGQGEWRIFSKLGMGSDGTFLDVGYACAPELDGAGNPIPDQGHEFFLAARQQTGGATWQQRDRQLAGHYRAVIQRIQGNQLLSWPNRAHISPSGLANRDHSPTE